MYPGGHEESGGMYKFTMLMCCLFMRICVFCNSRVLSGGMLFSVILVLFVK